MIPIRSLTCAVILAFLCVNYPYASDIISSGDLVWHHSDGPVVVWEVRGTNSAETRQFEHALPQNTGYQLLAAAEDQLIVASAYHNDYGYHAGSSSFYTLHSQSEQVDETQHSWTVQRSTDTTYQPVASSTPMVDLSSVGEVIFSQSPVTNPYGTSNNYPTAAELGPVGQLYTLRQHYIGSSTKTVVRLSSSSKCYSNSVNKNRRSKAEMA